MTPPLDSPLVPLPPPPRSAINERVAQPANDPNDLFDSLFTPTGDAIFQSQSQLAHGKGREAPSPLHSDFGAFVSVPTPEETNEHPLLLDFDDDTPPTAAKPKKPNFFDHMTEGARKNNEQNKKRVANQISQYEQDSLLWPESIGRKTGSPPSFINQQQSSPPTSQSDYMTQSHSSIPSQTMPEQPHTWKASNSRSNDRSDSLSTATLPRKWMSNLLSASVSSLPYTVKHGTVKSPPRHLSDSPPVTHTSPFASHIFIPPSGAPGFAGDYSWNKSGFVFDENDGHLRRLKLEGRKESTTAVLKSELAEQVSLYFSHRSGFQLTGILQIRLNLPPLPRLVKSWTLLYSSDQHGVSLQTLYARCASKISSTLVVIQDSEDCVFGIWMGGTIHSSSGYYGTGDSYVSSLSSLTWPPKGYFCFKGFCGPVGIERVSKHSNGRVKTTTLHFAIKTSFRLAAGGLFPFPIPSSLNKTHRTGKYGLYLSENLTDGSSAPCPTFNNPVLSGSSVHDTRDVTIDFECVGVEIWGITN